MKTKTIKKILNKVNKEFAGMFSDDVKSLVEKDAFITGGCITSMLLDEEVNDYDYYFRNSDSLHKALKEILESEDTPSEFAFSVNDDAVCKNKPSFEFEIKPDRVSIICSKDESDIVYFEGRKVIVTKNAVTLIGKKDEPIIQLVTRFVGNPDEIHENYDFEHTKCYFDPSENYLHLPQSSLESIITKELKYTGSKYPLASIIRTRKFIQRNWSVNAGQYLKMAIQLNDLNLSDPDVLKDQLVGVDMAYFQQIINDIENKIKKDKNFQLNTEYVMNLIDEKFDEEWAN